MVGAANPARRGRPVAKFGIGRARRLTHRADFERLLREGTRRNLSGFVFYLERRAEGLPRLGILISRKHAARAFVRNRVKRCIREAFRLEQEKMGALDILVRPPYGVKPNAEMIRSLQTLFSRLEK